MIDYVSLSQPIFDVQASWNPHTLDTEHGPIRPAVLMNKVAAAGSVLLGLSQTIVQ
jgi:hypothetical protein